MTERTPTPKLDAWLALPAVDRTELLAKLRLMAECREADAAWRGRGPRSVPARKASEARGLRAAIAVLEGGDA